MPEPKRPSLTVLGGPKAGTRFPLAAGEYLLGSDSTCVFELPLPGVSPTHARLVVDDNGVTIHDAGGRGLHVNDTRVGPAGELLRNGDIVWLGTPGEADVVMLQCILPGRPAAARDPDAATIVAKPKPAPPAAHAAPVPPAYAVALEPPAALPPLHLASEMDDVEAELASAEAVPFIPEPSPPADLLIEGTAVEAEPILAEPIADEAGFDVVPEEGGFTTEPSFPVGVPAAASVIVEEAAPPPPVAHPKGPAGFEDESEEAFIAEAPAAAPPAPPNAWLPEPDEGATVRFVRPPLAPEPTVALGISPAAHGVPPRAPLPRQAPAAPPAPPARPQAPPSASGPHPAASPGISGPHPPLPRTAPGPHPPAPRTGSGPHPSAPPTASGPHPPLPRPPSPPPPRPAAQGVVAPPLAPSGSGPHPPAPPSASAGHPPVLRAQAGPGASGAHPAHHPQRREGPGGLPPHLPEAPLGAKRGGGAGLLIGAAVIALLVVGGGLFAVWRFVVKPRMGAAVAQVTPPPPLPSIVARPKPTPTPMPTTPQEAIPTPEPTPEVQATPPPVPSPTPSVKAPPSPSPSTKATPTPSPSAKATPTPSPSPSPKKAASSPPPTSAAVTAAGPSAEQQRASQVATLLGQADSAIGNHQYDQAVGLFDDALRVDPGNSRATSQRAHAVQLRDAARKRFVAGRTTVTTDKAGGGGLSGFEGAAVQKAPDFLGRIEFDMTPASGLQAGDAWSLRLYVVNEGKKAIRITALQVSTVTNGERSGGSTPPKGRDIEPQQRVLVGEVSGTWKDATTSWAAEAAVVARGDSLKNTLTWR